MSRFVLRILAPYIIGGGGLLTICLIGVRYVNHLDDNMTAILTNHLAGQLAAKELESAVHHLRYDILASLAAAGREGGAQVGADEQAVKAAIEAVDAAARSNEEKQLVGTIRAAFALYLLNLDRVAAALWPDPQPLLRLTGKVDDILRPTKELVRLNQQMARSISVDSQQTRDRIRRALLLIGLGGPIAGLGCGFAVARSLGRSIHELSINVSDLSQRIGVSEEVKFIAGGGIDHVNEQVRQVMDRVRTVVSQMHQQERELIRAEQLARVGQLAAMVAHEIRNPLSAVTILVTMATRTANPVPLTGEDLKVISGELARVEKTVQGLLDLSRPARIQAAPLDIRGPVNTGVELVRRRAESQRVALDVKLPGRPVTVRADRGQLTSVFVNLYMNALDEMRSGGRLEVRMTCDGGKVEVKVSDTGQGIPVDVTECVFEPFHTSKPTGTGLGLHIAQRVVEDHGGALVAFNRPAEEGTGAVFMVNLPECG